jgi:hypothetical protein
MKTKCYCVYCPKHPLHYDIVRQDVLTGWSVGDFIWEEKHREQGREVVCLNPKSDFFEDYGIDADEFEFPITAYNDGISETGTEEAGFTIYAYCGNEEYEDTTQ